MEEIILENSFIKVRVKSLGAELSSLKDKKSQRELMWQADDQVWPWHAPNLFPVVGQCRDNQIIIDEIAYPMKRHGFARHSEFTIVSAQPEHAVFSLKNSEETKKAYPFDFEFQILYDLIDAAIRITYKVINRDVQPVYFSLGAHPAFSVVLPEDTSYGDYYVEFAEPVPQHIYLLNAQGLFDGTTAPAPIKDGKMYLNPDLFKNDALVFKNIRSRSVSLKKRNSTEGITINFHDFPYLGIWSKMGSSFLCIEPWLGCADSEAGEMEFKEKEEIHHIEKGHVFEAAFSISIAN